MKKVVLLTAMLILGGVVSANELISKSPANARVYFISPQAGQTVQKKLTVRFGLVGMGVAPAGVNQKNTGHHHLLIDSAIESIDLTTILPATEKIRHFGGGQTEIDLELSPGTHTLQLLLGNYVHIPHDEPVVSQKITIQVQ